MRTAGGVAVLAALVLTLSGCAQLVQGSARPVEVRGPVDLERFLATPQQIDEIIGSTDIEVVDTSTEMSDLSPDVSDQDCAGALYNTEESIYQDTGWTDVIDQILAEPEDDSRHWVEQSVVLLETDQQALDFFERSVEQWTNCIGKDVTVYGDDDGDENSWRFEGISISGQMMTQTAQQHDGGGWACRHALGAVSNHIVEVAACGDAVDGGATAIADKIVENIA